MLEAQHGPCFVADGSNAFQYDWGNDLKNIKIFPVVEKFMSKNLKTRVGSSTRHWSST